MVERKSGLVQGFSCLDVVTEVIPTEDGLIVQTEKGPLARVPKDSLPMGYEHLIGKKAHPLEIERRDWIIKNGHVVAESETGEITGAIGLTNYSWTESVKWTVFDKSQK